MLSQLTCTYSTCFKKKFRMKLAPVFESLMALGEEFSNLFLNFKTPQRGTLYERSGDILSVVQLNVILRSTK